MVHVWKICHSGLAEYVYRWVCQDKLFTRIFRQAWVTDWQTSSFMHIQPSLSDRSADFVVWAYSAKFEWQIGRLCCLCIFSQAWVTDWQTSLFMHIQPSLSDILADFVVYAYSAKPEWHFGRLCFLCIFNQAWATDWWTCCLCIFSQAWVTFLYHGNTMYYSVYSQPSF